MITPRFTLQQSQNTCTIKLRAPYTRLNDLDVTVEDNVFLFYCKPYYLRLTLPGSLVENEASRSSFDSDTGEFTFTYEKLNPGEDFKDLDFITKFLTPKIEVMEAEGGRKIEVLTSEGEAEVVSSDSVNGFGFAMLGHYNFSGISAEFSDVFEVDPREVNLNERKKLRLQYEQGKFNTEHYLADLHEDEEIQEIILQKLAVKLEDGQVVFSAKELDFLKDLSNVDYELTELQRNYCYNGLIDILFAYCYDRRTTFFEGTTESSWTITKLAATLCWLDGFDNPKDALICCFRRSLIYPLYRHFGLSQCILKDLMQILKLGEKYIIKCLIEIYQIFLTGDCGSFVLNNLFIKDYVQYIMKWNSGEWNKIVDELEKIVINEEDLGLNLKEIERGYNLCKKLQNLNLEEEDSDDSSLDSETDSDDFSDSDTDDTSSSDSCVLG